jgi:YgiT-type zinc finger domain-containing protein
MVRSTASFSIDRKGYHIVWEAVPAWVCTQCGEPFFEASEVEAIQRALEAVDRESAALVPESSRSCAYFQGACPRRDP